MTFALVLVLFISWVDNIGSFSMFTGVLKSFYRSSVIKIVQFQSEIYFSSTVLLPISISIRYGYRSRCKNNVCLLFNMIEWMGGTRNDDDDNNNKQQQCNGNKWMCIDCGWNAINKRIIQNTHKFNGLLHSWMNRVPNQSMKNELETYWLLELIHFHWAFSDFFFNLFFIIPFISFLFQWMFTLTTIW